MRKSKRNRLYATLIIIVASIVWIFLGMSSYNSNKDHMIDDYRSEFTTVSSEFDKTINKTVTYIDSLKAFTYSQFDYGVSDKVFNTYASTSNSTENYIRNFSIAPDNIQTFVYPLEGNEVTLGHNLSEDHRDDVRNDVMNAELTQKTVISGPYELRQGGLGMVVRSPLFIDSDYWGLVNVVVDVDTLLDSSLISKGENDIAYQISNDQGVFWRTDNFEHIDFEYDILLLNNHWTVEGHVSQKLSEAYMLDWIQSMAIYFVVIVLLSYTIIRTFNQNFLLSNRLSRLIFVDSLTALPNRRALEKQLTDLVDAKIPFGLAFIDLDNFKKINDTLGHSTGDKILVELSSRLKKYSKLHAYRWGGDEFVLVREDFTKEEFLQLLNHISQKISETIHIDDMEFNIYSSAGITFYPNDGQTMEDIIRVADVTMYSAKESGKSSIRIYDQNIETLIKEDYEIERNLEVALKSKKLELYYQPRFNYRLGKIDASEALLRWKDESGHFISPGRFIPLAERTQLIHAIDLYVLEEVIKQQSMWRSEGMRMKTSFNISSKHLDESFMKRLDDLLKLYDIDPILLEIEIVERIAIENIDGAQRFIEHLNAKGITVALDDFGTGYSALGYLSKLDISVLKIDKSFIDKITTNKNDHQVLKSIFDIARTYDFTIIAEGVETKEQDETLREMNCDGYQGYLLSQALPNHEFKAFVKNFNKI